MRIAPRTLASDLTIDNSDVSSRHKYIYTYIIKWLTAMNLTACAPETPTWTRRSSQSLDRSIPWHCRPARRLTRRRPWAGVCWARKRAIARPTSNPSLKSISSLSRLSLIRAHLRYLWNWWGCARSVLFPLFRPRSLGTTIERSAARVSPVNGLF